MILYKSFKISKKTNKPEKIYINYDKIMKIFKITPNSTIIIIIIIIIDIATQACTTH